MNNNRFIKPELEIILFEGELATDDIIIVSSGEQGAPGEGEGDFWHLP